MGFEGYVVEFSQQNVGKGSPGGRKSTCKSIGKQVHEIPLYVSVSQGSWGLDGGAEERRRERGGGWEGRWGHRGAGLEMVLRHRDRHST